MQSDWLLLVLTGIIGYLCGAWLYLTVFVPEYVENSYIAQLQEERKQPYTITAEEYGECELYGDCRAFSLEGDRSYRYQDYDGEYFEGRISRKESERITDVLSNSVLVGRDQHCVSEKINHVSYSIYFRDNYYVMEACGDTSSVEPISTFSSLWEYFFTIVHNKDDVEVIKESTSTSILQSPTDVLFSEDVVQ